MLAIYLVFSDAIASVDSFAHGGEGDETRANKKKKKQNARDREEGRDTRGRR